MKAKNGVNSWNSPHFSVKNRQILGMNPHFAEKTLDIPEMHCYNP